MRALSREIRLCIHSGPEPSSWRMRLRMYCAVTAISVSPDDMAKSALWPNCETIEPSSKSKRVYCSRLNRRPMRVMSEISKSSSSQLAGSSSTSSRAAPL